jgi:hypothetical protein
MTRLSITALLGLAWLAAAPSAAFADNVVFGPKIFVRPGDQPVVQTESFRTCELEAKHRLVVENGERDGSERVASATVLVNGVKVVDAGELGRKVARVEKTVTLHSANLLQVRLESGPPGKVTVRLECRSGCLGIEIDAPAADADVDRSTALVTGRYTGGADEIGVSVNGVPAAWARGLFAAQVPLEAGENRITAAATTACGERVEASVRVHVSTMEQKAQLDARPAGGAAPLPVKLQATPLFQGRVARYEWDFNGDGKIDQSGTDLAEVAPTYAAEGMFLPRVTLVDQDGKRYTETTPVHVFSEGDVQALLLKKWDGLRSALGKQDVDAAADSFAQSTRERYRTNFTTMRDVLPVMAQDLGTPKFVRFVQNGALYEVRSARDGREYTFQVEFMVDVDGIWRIRWF